MQVASPMGTLPLPKAVGKQWLSVFAYNLIFIVGVGYLRCLLFFFLAHVAMENNMKKEEINYLIIY